MLNNKTNWLNFDTIIVDEMLADELCEQALWQINVNDYFASARRAAEENIMADISSSFTKGPTSVEDLKKALNRSDSMKIRKREMIVIDSFYDEFCWYFSTEAIKSTRIFPLTHCYWMKLHELSFHEAYSYAFTLLKEWKAEEVYIVKKGEILVLGKEFCNYITSIKNDWFKKR